MYPTRPTSLVLTVVYWPPERICAIDLAMDGFSATHNTRMCYAKVPVAVPRDVSQGGIFAVESTS